MTVGVGLAVVSLAMLIYFIHHVTQSIQVSHVEKAPRPSLDAAISRLFPEHAGQPVRSTAEPSKRGEAVMADTAGYIEAIESEALLKIAADHCSTLTVVSRPGDFAVAGMPLVLVDPPVDDECSRQIRDAFALGRRRTPQQDAVFAFLQMADIALRALSPSLNDPLTANMCLDRITSAMCLLAERSLPEPVRTGASGRGRVIAHPYSYEDLVSAAYHHIANAAREQPMVRERCRWCMALVLERPAPLELREAVERELERIEREPPNSGPSAHGNLAMLSDPGRDGQGLQIEQNARIYLRKENEQTGCDERAQP